MAVIDIDDLFEMGLFIIANKYTYLYYLFY